MSEAIQITRNIFIGTWLQTKDSEFIKNHNIGLIIYAPCILEPRLGGLAGFQFDCFEEDEDKFSSLVLRRKCEEIVVIINKKGQDCQSVLVSDFTISSTAGYICCLILMTKFKWNLLKTLQYITHKIPSLHIDQVHTQRLLIYDKNYITQLKSQVSQLWNRENEISEQALLARNTYINSSHDFKNDEHTNNMRRKPRSYRKVQFKQQGESKYINQNPISATPTKFSQSYYSHKNLFISIPDSQPQKSVTRRFSIQNKKYGKDSGLRTSVPQLRTENLRKKSQNKNFRVQAMKKAWYLKSIQDEKISNLQGINKIEEKINQKFRINNIRKKDPSMATYLKTGHRKQVPRLRIAGVTAGKQI